MFVLLNQELSELDEKIEQVDRKLTAAHKANPVSKLLATAPGIGPVTALTFAIEVDPGVFQTGRHLAAWLV